LRRWSKQQAPEELPKGLGKLTFVTLLCEIGDWNRFTNRKQVAAFTGLCLRESSSGKKKRYGHISKHGNPRVRSVLVELAWRLVRWQPDCKLIEKHKDKLTQEAFCGNKKKAIVAISRQLSIDLWRLFTEQTTMEKLGLTAVN
jgi:transposase